MDSQDRPPGLSFIDRSGTIAAGGTAQWAVVSPNLKRRYFVFQNHSDTDMWINEDVVAVVGQPSIKIAAGGYYEPLVPPLGRISVICATTGKAFTCKEA